MVGLTAITYVPASMKIPLNEEIGFSALLQSTAIITAILSTNFFWLNKKIKNRINLKKAFIYSLFIFGMPMAAITISTSKILALSLMFVSGLGLSGLFIVPYAFLADIVEAENIKTRENKECMFYGIQGLVLKSCYGLGPFIVLYLQKIFPTDGLKMIGLFVIVSSLIAMAIFLNYPESEIKKTLKEKL